MLILYALLGAALFWLRGSAWFEHGVGRGKTTADLTWAIGVALPLPLFGASWLLVAIVATMLFAGGRAP